MELNPTSRGHHLHDVLATSVCSDRESSTNDLAQLHAADTVSRTCPHMLGL